MILNRVHAGNCTFKFVVTLLFPSVLGVLSALIHDEVHGIRRIGLCGAGASGCSTAARGRRLHQGGHQAGAKHLPHTEGRRNPEGNISHMSSKRERHIINIISIRTSSSYECYCNRFKRASNLRRTSRFPAINVLICSRSSATKYPPR